MLTISKYNDKFLKLDSPTISNLFPDGTVQNIEIEAKMNCCDKVYTTTFESVGQKWIIDLNKYVSISQSIQGFVFQNTIGGNTIISPAYTPFHISFGYIHENCATNDCTIEDFSSYYIPLFKEVFDGFAVELGYIDWNLTVVTIEGNIVSVENFPNHFIPYSLTFDDAELEQRFKLGGLDSKVFIDATSLYIDCNLFEQDTYLDGVYTIKLKYNSDNTYTQESNCAFIDVNTKCRVATLLQNIKEENEKINNEKVSTTVHILHYALINGSNCSCACGELCEVYKELTDLLGSINTPLILNDCGC